MTPIRVSNALVDFKSHMNEAIKNSNADVRVKDLFRVLIKEIEDLTEEITKG